FEFRDKHLMKELALKNGFSVPKFKLLNSPCCLLSFVEEHGLPVMVKPRCGSASTGLHLLETHQQVVDFLSYHYFSVLDSQGNRLEAYGEWLVEKLMEGSTMYHVNGFLEDGKVTHLWAFQQIHSNYLFTKGEPYGNIALVSTDPHFPSLCQATQTLLNCYTVPKRFVFHIEFFKLPKSSKQWKNDVLENTLPSSSSSTSSSTTKTQHPLKNSKSKFNWVLCEIAARSPGGTIPSLITTLLQSSNPLVTFEQLVFRFQCGLPLPTTLKRPTRRVADLLIPHRPHTFLVHVPDSSSFPFHPYIQYQVYGTAGHSYHQFHMNSINTLAKFSTTMELNESMGSIWVAFKNAYTWFIHQCQWMPLSSNAHPPSQLTKPSLFLNHVNKRFEQLRMKNLQVACRYRSPSFTLLRHLRQKPRHVTTLVKYQVRPWQRVFQRPSQALVRITPWMALHRRVWYASRHSKDTAVNASSKPVYMIPTMSPVSSALIRVKDLPKFPVLDQVKAKLGTPEWKEGKKFIWVSEKLNPHSTYPSQLGSIKLSTNPTLDVLSNPPFVQTSASSSFSASHEGSQKKMNRNSRILSL
ncbi:hypothetical protein HMI55_006637, partial [Coelomomyces lativittatus]